MRKQITEALVRRVRPPPHPKRLEISDTLLSGFQLRVTSEGRKSFSVLYRVHGKLARFTVGTWPMLTLAEARETARGALLDVQRGKDPAVERRALRTRLPEDFETIVDRFIEKHAKPNNRRWAETKRIFDRYVTPQWKGRSIRTIGRRDVADLLDHIETTNGAVMADRTLAAVRKMFNWFAARDDDFNSPIVRGMARTKPKERERERVLTHEELSIVWKVAQKFRIPFGAVVQGILLSAQRPGEVMGMRRASIDSRGVLTIEAEDYKTKEMQVIPLSRWMLTLIESQPKIGTGEYIFTTRGDRPFSGDSKAKRAFDAAVLDELRAQAVKAGLDPAKVKPPPRWTLQDLRRTSRSIMSDIGIDRDIAERVLGHALPGMQGVYDRADRIDAKRAAVESLAEEIRRIVGGAKAKVVPMRSRVR